MCQVWELKYWTWSLQSTQMKQQLQAMAEQIWRLHMDSLHMLRSQPSQCWCGCGYGQILERMSLTPLSTQSRTRIPTRTPKVPEEDFHSLQTPFMPKESLHHELNSSAKFSASFSGWTGKQIPPASTLGISTNSRKIAWPRVILIRSRHQLSQNQIVPFFK